MALYSQETRGSHSLGGMMMFSLGHTNPRDDTNFLYNNLRIHNHDFPNPVWSKILSFDSVNRRSDSSPDNP